MLDDYKMRTGLLVVITALLSAGPSAGQKLSPGESQIVIPTADARQDARLSIGYGQLPADVSSPPSARDPLSRSARDELYVITIQFIPRLSLHYRQSFKRADFIQATGDRVLGAQFKVIKQGRIRPGLAFGIRDTAGTRKHHATYAVMTRTYDFKSAQLGATVGVSRAFLDATFLEMKDGPFWGLSLRFRDRIELLAEHDTRFFYAGSRIWPIKWLWLTGFAAEGKHPGFAFGISHSLRGGSN